jgi:hypothetical protein
VVAGHYIPIIATKVQEHHLQNNLGQGKLTLLQRLEGIILINPWTAPEHDEQGKGEGILHMITVKTIRVGSIDVCQRQVSQ